MGSSVLSISVQGLVLAFIPAIIVIAIVYRWGAGAQTAVYATGRMLVQLLLIGYVLAYIFETDQPLVIIAVLTFMLLVASWIAIRPLQGQQAHAYLHALAAISISGLFTLALVSQAVIGVEPWFSPRYLVPLAGMIFAGSMNTVSLAAERFRSETQNGAEYADARRTALNASLIPITNSLLAVGLVSLPGMMTGQILSGISPLVAAKYQIVVMTMLYGTSGMSAAIFIVLARKTLQAKP